MTWRKTTITILACSSLFATGYISGNYQRRGPEIINYSRVYNRQDIDDFLEEQQERTDELSRINDKSTEISPLCCELADQLEIISEAALENSTECIDDLTVCESNLAICESRQ